ncbi:MAG: arginine--tRNA ligase [Candidatus Nitrosocosmicus sp.]|nr:arginine--tRNA ligase [Candidatus Nitrosocosmicus sp.]
MIIENIIQEINIILKDVLSYYDQEVIATPYDISEPPVREFGDYSTNIAFVLSKLLKKSPMQIANEITQEILPSTQSWGTKKYLQSSSTQPPGFINFFLKKDIIMKEFMKKVNAIEEIIKYESNDEPDTIIIEHTSVNPNKALHVGHVRNAIIGDCLFRIFKKVGKNVKVLNYVDDSGLQVADIIVGLKYAGIPMPDSNQSGSSDLTKFDQYCGNEVYVKINEMYSSKPDLLERRKDILKDLEDPESEVSKYTHDIVMKVLAGQLQTSWNLKCRYDLINFESQIVQSNLWRSTFETLKEKGIIFYEESGANKGCWVYKSSSIGDKVLVRSDSTITYFAKDIPYAIWKLGYLNNPFDFRFYSSQWDTTNLYATVLKDKKTRQGFNISNQSDSQLIDFNRIKKVITIIDSRQERLQALLSEILMRIGIPIDKYEYLGYEPVILSKGSLDMLGIQQEKPNSAHMSGRKGIFIEADRALSILEQESLDETMKRNPEITQAEAKHIASAIAVSAIRYFFIKFDLGKMITFDINDSLSLDGDTAPYIQYAYARGKKVEEKVSKSNIASQDMEPDIEYRFEFTSIEIELIWHICKYTIILGQATDKSNPKLIAKYLFQLATLFNNFYDKSPILSEKNQNVARSRVILLRAALLVMKECMYLIGISAIPKM